MKILVCSDDMQLIMSVCDTLGKNGGHNVYTACDGGTAAAAYLERKPDLVLLDLNLPEHGGGAFMYPLLWNHPAAKIVLLAEESELDKVVDFIKRGAKDFLVKPIDSRAVLKTVEAFRAIETNAQKMFRDNNFINPAVPLENIGRPDIESALAAKLERGFMLLEDREWDKAFSFFGEVLDLKPENVAAHVGRALASERARSLEQLAERQMDNRLLMRYHYFGEEKIPVDSAYIERMVAQYEVPGFLSREDIEKLLKYSGRYVKSGIKQCKDFLSWTQAYWSERSDNNHLARAFRYARGRNLENLNGAREMILGVMRRRVQNAQEDFAQDLALTRACYRKYLFDGTIELADLKKKAEVNRENCYQAARRSAEQAEKNDDFDQLTTAIKELRRLGNYRDARQILLRCKSFYPELHAKDEALKREQERKEKELQEQQRRQYEAQRRRIRRRRFAVVLLILAIGAAFAANRFIVQPAKIRAEAEDMIEDGNYQEAIELLGDGVSLSDSAEYTMAETLLEEGNLRAAATMFGAAGDYKDARERSRELWDRCIASGDSVSLYTSFAFGIKADGTVCSTDKENHWENISEWTDIVQIEYDGDESPRYTHAAGLRSDGTVLVSCLDNRYCRGEDCDTSSWTDIVDIAVSSSGIFGLRSDGKVVHSEANPYDAEVIDKMDMLVDIECEGGGLVGLRVDGRILVSNENYYKEFQNLSDVKEIDMGWGFMAVAPDGAIHTAHVSHKLFEGFEAEKHILTYTSSDYVMGLSSEGTVVWGPEFEACDDQSLKNELATWTGLVDLYGRSIIVGLKEDGSLLVSSNYSPYSDEISTWTDLRVPR